MAEYESLSSSFSSALLQPCMWASPGMPMKMDLGSQGHADTEGLGFTTELFMTQLLVRFMI